MQYRKVDAERVVIRSEQPGDSDAIGQVHRAAFPTDMEARLVEKLRQSGRLWLSLVAEDASGIIGHIAFSPVRIEGNNEPTPGVGLAPVAVRPDYQRQGIGSWLICEGLSACKQTGFGFVVVLGEPAYYHRLGFEPASRWKLSNEYGADESFMAMELQREAFPTNGGLVVYAPEFAELIE